MDDILEGDHFKVPRLWGHCSVRDVMCESEFPLPPTGGVEAFLHAHPGPGESAQAGELHPRQLNVSTPPGVIWKYRVGQNTVYTHQGKKNSNNFIQTSQD